MTRWKFHRHGIFDFAFGENAMEKSFAEAIERMLNARAFHQIDTDTDDTHLPDERTVGTARCALRTPQRGVPTTGRPFSDDRFKQSSLGGASKFIRDNSSSRRAFLSLPPRVRPRLHAK